MEDKLINYLQNRLRINRKSASSLIVDQSGQPYHQRNLKILIDKYVANFLSNPKSQPKWLVIPGLRGVGKTTLLTQVYVDLLRQETDLNILYISLDEVVDNLNTNLYELLTAYRSILGTSLEEVNQPTFILIDEVQADPKWARTLKAIYDSTHQVFLICSGSSAVHLQMDADIAGRRATITKLHPLNFSEFQLLGYNKYPIKDLKQSIIKALYYSANAKEAYQALAKLKPLVNQAWTKYSRDSLSTYLNTGTLTFSLGRSDSLQLQQAIQAMLDKIVETDLADFRQFDQSSLVAIKRLLAVLADSSEVISSNKLAQILAVSRSQVFAFLDVLVKAEVLIKVPAWGNNINQARWPARYYFMTPAIRNFYANFLGLTITQSSLKGFLLEDLASLHYYREFLDNYQGRLTYLRGEGQADFILEVKQGSRLAIEFGWGQKSYRQTKTTMNQVDCLYGLVFTETSLEYEAENCLKIPLDYFFLI